MSSDVHRTLAAIKQFKRLLHVSQSSDTLNL